MKTKLTTNLKRRSRQARVRAKVKGTVERPRLNVYRSRMSMFAQLIDDVAGQTLISVHSRIVTGNTDVGERKAKVAVAYAVGKTIAEKAKAMNIAAVVFDRAGYRYHGRVQAVAEGARDGGLQF